jgi:hypothetical protein
MRAQIFNISNFYVLVNFDGFKDLFNKLSNKNKLISLLNKFRVYFQKSKNIKLGYSIILM